MKIEKKYKQKLAEIEIELDASDIKRLPSLIFDVSSLPHPFVNVKITSDIPGTIKEMGAAINEINNIYRADERNWK